VRILGEGELFLADLTPVGRLAEWRAQVPDAFSMAIVSEDNRFVDLPLFGPPSILPQVEAG
jgi:hypothetical protein